MLIMRTPALAAVLLVAACGAGGDEAADAPSLDEPPASVPPVLAKAPVRPEGSVSVPPRPSAPPFHMVRYDVNQILSTGQSLAVGASSVAESITQPYGNLMLAFGVQAPRGFDQQFVPLIEWNVETMSSALANELTELAAKEGVADFVSLVSIHAGGGTPYSGIMKGTEFYVRGMGQVKGARDRAKLNGQTHVVRAVTSVHGESDNAAHSPTYASDIVTWQRDYETDVRAITGQALPVPMFHTQNSQNGQSRIPLDMLAAHVAAPGKVVLVGPKYHLAYADGTHLTTASYKHLGEDYAKAYRRVVLQGETWEPVRPKSVTRCGKEITIVFFVPSPPLVLDTSRVAATAHFGFGYVEASNEIAKPAPAGQSPTVASVTVTAPDTVVVTLSAAPTTPGRVRYAIDYVDPDGPRGNLRDSDRTPSRFGFDLFNWGVQFEENVP